MNHWVDFDGRGNHTQRKSTYSMFRIFFPSTNAGVQARLTFSNDDSDPATRDNTSSAMIGVN